jgi:hypothetical protein
LCLILANKSLHYYAKHAKFRKIWKYPCCITKKNFRTFDQTTTKNYYKTVVSLSKLSEIIWNLFESNHNNIPYNQLRTLVVLCVHNIFHELSRRISDTYSNPGDNVSLPVLQHPLWFFAYRCSIHLVVSKNKPVFLYILVPWLFVMDLETLIKLEIEHYYVLVGCSN